MRPIRARPISISTRATCAHAWPDHSSAGRDPQRSELRRLCVRIDLQLGQRHPGAAVDAPARADRDGYGRLQNRHSGEPSLRSVLVPPARARHRAQPSGARPVRDDHHRERRGQFARRCGEFALAGDQRPASDVQGNPGSCRRHHQLRQRSATGRRRRGIEPGRYQLLRSFPRPAKCVRARARARTTAEAAATTSPAQTGT
jgi:hypothetical protein